VTEEAADHVGLLEPPLYNYRQDCLMMVLLLKLINLSGMNFRIQFKTCCTTDGSSWCRRAALYSLEA